MGIPKISPTLVTVSGTWKHWLSESEVCEAGCALKGFSQPATEKPHNPVEKVLAAYTQSRYRIKEDMMLLQSHA